MISQVEIVNLALARLGESPIQSMDEGSAPANMAKAFYEPAKRATLRGFPWGFAIATERLARIDEKPVGFRFAFAVPSDCLRAVRLVQEGQGEPLRFELRGGKVLANEAPVILEYVEDVDDPNRFDDKFIEAFSFKLASDLAVPVKGSNDLMANFMNVFNDLIAKAAAISSKEGDSGLPDNPFVEARFYGPR